MSTIPASQIVQVVPSVLAAGGNALDVVGLAITENVRVPIGTVASFPTQVAVDDFFGAGSDEALFAANYFGSFEGAQALPAALLFAQYPGSAVAAYLRGGDVSGLTLAQLQAISGSLTAIVDGYSHVITSISLSGDNSFSAAAASIQEAFTDPTEASFTASIGASFMCTAGSPSTKLVVTSVTGLISVGDTVVASGAPANTTIVSQDSGGTPGGAGTYVLSAANTASAAPGTANSTVLDVTVCASPTIAVGQTLAGAGVTGALITAQLGGTPGGIGTYRISGVQQQVASEAMTGVATAPLVTYDSVSGAFVVTSGITGAPSTAAFATGTIAAPLKLTAATGAVLSQGADAATPAGFMNGVIAQTTNWVNYGTLFDPDGGSGNAVKQAFAAWKNTALGGNRFGYVCWDTDAAPTVTLPASSSLGQILAANNDSGTSLIWAPDAATGRELAAFEMGAAASIAFGQTNGRVDFAFLAQAGIAGDVSDPTVATNLGGRPQTADRGNGYNFYGAYGQANQDFVWFQRGFVTGPFLWFDSFVNQVWLNNALGNALLVFLGSARSVPFNAAGDSLLENALADPIAQGLSFGAFAPGPITSSQIAQVNASAGRDIATTLQTQGFYVLIQPASGSVRAARGPRQIVFYYLDRGSVQSVNLSSVAVQ